MVQNVHKCDVETRGLRCTHTEIEHFREVQQLKFWVVELLVKKKTSDTNCYSEDFHYTLCLEGIFMF